MTFEKYQEKLLKMCSQIVHEAKAIDLVIQTLKSSCFVNSYDPAHHIDANGKTFG